MSDCPRGQQERTCYTCELEAENARLRDELAAVEALRARLAREEEIDALIEQSSLGSPEARAVRETVPADVSYAIVAGSRYYERAERAEAENARLRAVALIGNKMMGSMNGPSAPPHAQLWHQFELALADLVNDGLLDVSGEGT